MQDLQVLVFVALILSCRTVFAQNETLINAGGVNVKVLRYSGAISMSRQPDIESDENKITIKMVEIREKDEHGIEVGKGGPPSQHHNFNDFSSQEFEIGNVYDGSFAGIAAKSLNFSCNIATGAELALTLYVFTESGQIDLDGENTTVSEGSVKLNILIKNWKFCGMSVYCINEVDQTQEAGQYLDIAVEIKGSLESPEQKISGKRTTTDEYDLGSGSVVISNKVSVNISNF